MTGIGMYSEKVEEPESPKSEKDEEGYIDDNDILKNLGYFDKNNDDLAELRKLINKTQRNISNYAGEVQVLEKCVSGVNVGFRSAGYGVNDDIFWNMER